MADHERVLEVIDDLLGEWDSLMLNPGGLHIKPRRPKTEQQTAMVVALGLHVRAVAEVLRPSLVERVPAAYTPMVRAAYETAVTMIWLDKNDDAAEAMMNEFGRQRRLLKEAMQESANLTELAERVTHADAWELTTTQGAEARNLQKRVESLGAQGSDLYAIYRQMCAHTHPGVALADQYLEEDPDGGLVLLPRPTGHGKEPWIVAVCLAWATRILCHYSPDTALRNRVRAHMRELGMAQDL